MAVTVQCFGCSNILELDDGFRGGVCRCSNCGSLLEVPKAARPEKEKMSQERDRPDFPTQELLAGGKDDSSIVGVSLRHPYSQRPETPLQIPDMVPSPSSLPSSPSSSVKVVSEIRTAEMMESSATDSPPPPSSSSDSGNTPSIDRTRKNRHLFYIGMILVGLVSMGIIMLALYIGKLNPG